MKGAFDKEPPEQGPLLEQLEQLQECEERALREKEATGRYTIARAAKIFVRNEPGFNESELCIRLTNAAREGELPRYASGTNARLRRPPVRDFLDEVLWKDLNAWLNEQDNEPETTYRFPKPASQIVDDGETATTPPLTEVRIAAIVEMAKRLKYDPLFVATGGKAIIEAECLDKLKGAPHRFTADTFKKAWQAARNAGLIDVENVEIYRGQKATNPHGC